LTELVWRDFSYNILYFFSDLPKQNLQQKFDNFPWQENHELLTKWQKGETGYPIVDAGMRELWQTGFMHNRVRMIVASFLVKHLMIDWRHGADWFNDCLVDADLANNSASWQWVAGSGADAAPYFRIFNPILQGQKFDPKGVYTRKFVPELKNMPIKYLFSPWLAPASFRAGVNYPAPIIEHEGARKRALKSYSLLKNI
jgi:deoxyribodipyrimidine photo-lyase